MLRPPLDTICHSLGGEKHVLWTPPGVGWGCEQVFHDNPAHTPIPRSPRTRSSVVAHGGPGSGCRRQSLTQTLAPLGDQTEGTRWGVLTVSPGSHCQ